MATGESQIPVVNEYAQKSGLQIEWTEVEPDHYVFGNAFSFRLTIGEFFAVGSGRRKNEAKNQAAANLMKILKENGRLQATSSQRKSISVLQERCQKAGRRLPVYEHIDTRGSPNDRTFTFNVSVISPISERELNAKGTGKTKQSAKQNAANEMLQMLRDEEGDSSNIDTSRQVLSSYFSGMPDSTNAGGHGGIGSNISPSLPHAAPQRSLYSTVPPPRVTSSSPQTRRTVVTPPSGHVILSRGGSPGEPVVTPAATHNYSSSYLSPSSVASSSHTMTSPTGSNLDTEVYELPSLPPLGSLGSFNSSTQVNIEPTGSSTVVDSQLFLPSTASQQGEVTNNQQIPVPKPRKKKPSIENQPSESESPVISGTFEASRPQPVHLDPTSNLPQSFVCESTDSRLSHSIDRSQPLAPVINYPRDAPSLTITTARTLASVISDASGSSLPPDIPEYVVNVEDYVRDRVCRFGRLTVTKLDYPDTNGKYLCFVSFEAAVSCGIDMPITAIGAGDTEEIAKNTALKNLWRS
jgi:hypothetical protein